MRQIPVSERLTRTLKNVKRISDYVFCKEDGTFATRLVMAGVDLVTVKELLGHKSIKMTMRYSHPSTAHKRWAVGVAKRKARLFSVKRNLSKIKLTCACSSVG